MSEKNNQKNIIIISSIFVVVLVGLATLFYININKNKTIEVEAIVKLVGSNYIIVEDKDGQEYSLKTNEKYNIGDHVDFIIKDIKKDSYPKEGTLVKIDTISKNINLYITDDNNGDTSNTEESNDNVENNNIETETQNTVTETSTTDNDVVGYFEKLSNDFETYNQNQSIGETLKSGFVTIVDFLFYEGTIKGKTFKELSTTAKIKVLKLAFAIDEKIEKYFPNYKEQISSTGKKIYTNVKAKALELYLDITTKVCTEDPNTCQFAKEGLRDLKENFSLTWEYIKQISGVGLSKLKEWYKVWKTV